MLDPGDIPHDDPLAYFLTWTTYGTWLPGDERGWIKEAEGFQQPDWRRKHESRRKLQEEPCILNGEQRVLVEATIRRHCEIRSWKLWTVSARTNHVHVVVSATANPKTIMDQLKAWCTRRLKELNSRRNCPVRINWWTEDGSRRFLNDQTALEDAVIYVAEGQ